MAKETIGNITVNFEANRVWADNKEVKLTVLEYQLLRLLWQNKGRFLTHATIIDYLWEDNSMARKALMMVIVRLRKKLGWNIITNRRDIGYGILGKEE